MRNANVRFVGLAIVLAGCGGGAGAPEAGVGSDLAAAADLAGAVDAGAIDLPMSLGGDLAPGVARAATQANGRYFPAGAPWYVDVSQAQAAGDSRAITEWMVGDAPPNGWGTGTMQIDFSIVAVEVPAGTTKQTYSMASGFYYAPDCDTAPVPLPPGGAVEQSYGSPIVFTSAWSGYECAGFDKGDDCHVLLVARGENRLYEMYHATWDAMSGLQVGCLAIWDTSVVAPDGRGEQCTSADAAGFPMSPLLFTVEEVAAGHIDHAIRFILPNSMIRARQYVPPATHGTRTSGPATSGPYGFQMRLRGDYPVGNLSPAAQVVAKALQKYGMYLADGGSIALTAQSDVLSAVKWTDVGLDAGALSELSATDFEVIAYPTPTAVTDDCMRTQIAQ